ncbi:hypothetical protein [Persicobacter psychrovividus]
MNKFEAYKATDFLQEEGFVDWVKHPDGATEDIRFWAQWVALHPEKRQEIERAKNIHGLLAMPEGPFEAEKSRVWSRLQSSIIAEQQTEIEQAKKEFSFTFAFQFDTVVCAKRFRVASAIVRLLMIPPVTYGNLNDDNGRISSIAVFNYFPQIFLLLIVMVAV